jgi:hypothetical protein
MEQSSSEANSSPAGQEIPLILWNPKVHNLVHKSRHHVCILSQMNSFHACPISMFLYPF